MKITSKKGSALLIAILILLAILMASLSGLQAHSKHFTREILGQETRYAQGYYADLAGLRYAALLLRDPAALHYPYPVTGRELGGDLFGDLGVTAQNFRITISGPDINEQYAVEAVYTY